VLRRLLRSLGVALVAIGVLTVAFIAYDLFGTEIFEAHSQAVLRHELSGLTASAPAKRSTASRPSDGRPSDGRQSGTAGQRSVVPDGPPPPEGRAIAMIEIPAIEVDKAVVQGVAPADLAEGPGHYPDTPMPGEAGNVAIAGHRTTYGGPFYGLGRLRPGDLILLTTRQGSFRYRVVRSFRVLPTDVAVVAPTKEAMLTLTTCAPRFSARERLVVQARLVGRALPAPAYVTTRSAPAPTPGRDVLAGSGRAASSAARLLASGRGGALGPAIGFAALEAVLAAAAWWALRRTTRWRRAALAVVATPVLLVGLFLFFEHLAPLLPPQV